MTLPALPDVVDLDPSSPNNADSTASETPNAGFSEKRVHCFDDPGDRARQALRVALGANRPLLVRGEPGVGKTQLAEAAAVALNRVLLAVTVDSRTESRDLLYSFDAVRRLAEAQLRGALRDNTPEGLEKCRVDLLPQNFLVPGPLWWAFSWESARDQALQAAAPELYDEPTWRKAKGAVLLIDEIDKAESDVPNGLLEALGSRQFLPPFGQKAVVMQTKAPPLVIITTNEERTLPDPFLRRCVVLHLRLPDDEPSASATAQIRAPERRSSKIPDRNLTVTLSDLLIRRGARHFPKADRGVLTKVAARLIADRTRARSQNQSLLPGQAEYLDLVRAVVASADSPEEQIANLELFAEFVLRKQVDR